VQQLKHSRGIPTASTNTNSKTKTPQIVAHRGVSTHDTLRAGAKPHRNGSSELPYLKCPPSTRYGSSLATRNGAVSPTPSVASTATVNTIGNKRKERDFEAEASSEETNIQVVVRCRGRNEREVKENSNVVVTADSVRGKVVELSMGSNALSNRSYNFDRVFSQAADQYMVFDDTVKPILDEVGCMDMWSQILVTDPYF